MVPLHIWPEVLFNDSEVNFISDWPGNSHDLNQIENIWYLIKRDLRGKDISTVSRLTQAFRNPGAKLDLDHLKNLALFLPRRLQAVI